MKKWEYLRLAPLKMYTTEELDANGRYGWELVAIQEPSVNTKLEWIYTFKRPSLEPEPDDCLQNI